MNGSKEHAGVDTHTKDGRIRVVITGLGPITAVGTGVESFWEGLRRERSPIRRVTRFDASIWRSRLAAEVDDFDPEDFIERKASRRLDRFGHFAISSARLALQDAGLDTQPLDPDPVAEAYLRRGGMDVHVHLLARQVDEQGQDRMPVTVRIRKITPEIKTAPSACCQV